MHRELTYSMCPKSKALVSGKDGLVLELDSSLPEADCFIISCWLPASPLPASRPTLEEEKSGVCLRLVCRAGARQAVWCLARPLELLAVAQVGWPFPRRVGLLARPCSLGVPSHLIRQGAAVCVGLNVCLDGKVGYLLAPFL